MNFTEMFGNSIFIENRLPADYISIWKFVSLADYQISNFSKPKIEKFDPFHCNNTYFKYLRKDIKKNSKLYICYWCLDYFFKYCHPHIQAPYILLTGEGSRSVPSKWKKFLNEKKIALWIGIHPDVYFHPKFMPIPEGYSPRHDNRFLVDKELEVLALNLRKKNKENLVYMNFTLENHPDRFFLFNKFKSASYCIKGTSKPFFDYLREMGNCKFTLSPRGKGLDCFRTWEALIVGSIPVVKSSYLNSLYKDLPVLIVKDWRVVNKRFLEQKYKEITSKKYKLDKLTMGYWKKEIARRIQREF